MVDDCSIADAVAAIDLFFANHVNRLRDLHFHDSQPDELSPTSEILSPILILEITFLRSMPSNGLTLPERLLTNLARTHIPVSYEYTRF